MEFRIADTFTDSLSRLTSDEQKAVKTTAFDLRSTRPIQACNFTNWRKPKITISGPSASPAIFA